MRALRYLSQEWTALAGVKKDRDGRGGDEVMEEGWMSTENDHRSSLRARALQAPARSRDHVAPFSFVASNRAGSGVLPSATTTSAPTSSVTDRAFGTTDASHAREHSFAQSRSCPTCSKAIANGNDKLYRQLEHVRLASRRFTDSLVYIRMIFEFLRCQSVS